MGLDAGTQGYEVVSTTIVCYFVVELLARIYAIGSVLWQCIARTSGTAVSSSLWWACSLAPASPLHFVRMRFEMFDAFIVVITFIFEFAF